MNDKQKGDAWIFSTLANDNRYVNYGKGGGDLPAPIGNGVLIRGGANVAQRKTFITPRGVATAVTAEELAYLMENPMFKLHKDNGFVTIEARAADPERVASDMNAGDPSRQLEAGDYETGPTDEDGHGAAPKPASAPAAPRRAAGGAGRQR